MAQTIYLNFSCLKAKVNFGLFNIDIAFVCAQSCHLWSDRADHALYKICIHRRRLADSPQGFHTSLHRRVIVSHAEWGRVDNLCGSKASRNHRCHPGGARHRFMRSGKKFIWINVRSLKNPNEENEVQKTFPKSAQGTRKAPHGRWSPTNQSVNLSWDRWQGERWTFFPQLEGSSHHDLTQQQVHQHWVAASTPTISPIFGCKRTMTVFASPSGHVI